MKAPLRIISLTAENIKKLVAVSITPTGDLVQITGRNGQGKTSVLDCIWWALAGAGAIQKSPIRRGQERASIKLDLGEIIVTRNFARAEGGQFTTTLTVESAEGARFGKAQTVLDGLLDSLALDPLAFARMKPKEKFDALKGMVPGVDFDKLAGLNLTDFQKRADLNRRAKEAAAQAAAIAISPITPKERVDEAALTDELTQVGEFNLELERRAHRRAEAAREVEALKQSAGKAQDTAAELRAQADALTATAAEYEAKARELEAKLAAAPPLEEPKDAAEVRARLDAAKVTNAAVEKSERRAALLATAERLEAEAEELTLAMAKREEEKRAAIAAAELPVEGITFAEDSILLNGEPFEQASGAEQLRASLAIAMAAKPRLRVIRASDGSLLDEEGLKIVEEMAGDRGFQVWIERVETSGKVGFVLEDGLVTHAPAAGDATAHAAE